VLLPGIPVVGPLTGGSSAFTSAGTAVAMQTLKNSRAHTDATDGSRQPHQYAWEAPRSRRGNTSNDTSCHTMNALNPSKMQANAKLSMQVMCD
jgi:hypothetical protein